jgi:hypothetical protein
MLDDAVDGSEPLLVRMADQQFLRSLREFRNLICYSNSQFDTNVHYCTAAIRRRNPFGLCWPPQDSVLVLPDPDPQSTKQNSSANELTEFERHLEAMHAGLGSLPWIRFSVVGRPVLAHSDIVVRRPWLNAYGKPVIKHIVDHFKIQ